MNCYEKRPERGIIVAEVSGDMLYRVGACERNQPHQSPRLKAKAG
jgi:hypothetical protein